MANCPIRFPNDWLPAWVATSTRPSLAAGCWPAAARWHEHGIGRCAGWAAAPVPAAAGVWRHNLRRSADVNGAADRPPCNARLDDLLRQWWAI